MEGEKGEGEGERRARRGERRMGQERREEGNLDETAVGNHLPQGGSGRDEATKCPSETPLGLAPFYTGLRG